MNVSYGLPERETGVLKLQTRLLSFDQFRCSQPSYGVVIAANKSAMASKSSNPFASSVPFIKVGVI
jgi:hypothetical protein